MTEVNVGLAALQAWAALQAQIDPDEEARPLWAQIAGEVDAYLSHQQDTETLDLGLFAEELAARMRHA